jgi:hypothetical protein
MKHIKNTAFATITILAATAFIACQDNRNCTFVEGANKLECPEKTYSTIVMGGFALVVLVAFFRNCCGA